MALTHPQMAVLVDGVMDSKIAEMGGGAKRDFEKDVAASAVMMQALVDRKKGPDGKARISLADLGSLGPMR